MQLPNLSTVQRVMTFNATSRLQRTSSAQDVNVDDDTTSSELPPQHNDRSVEYQSDEESSVRWIPQDSYTETTQRVKPQASLNRQIQMEPASYQYRQTKAPIFREMESQKQCFSCCKKHQERRKPVYKPTKFEFV